MAAVAAALASAPASPLPARPTSAAVPASAQTYSEADFDRVRKFDAHVHANWDDPRFLEVAQRDGFEMLSINVDYPDFPPLPVQASVARKMQAEDRARFYYSTAFPMDGFGTPGWTERTIAALDKAFANGAIAVKVWKNIGMVAKDAEGKRVFLDDPRFDGVMRHLEQRNIPLIAHQGEPKNCWLPLDQMTTENDRAYFSAHPEYYMHLHPEEPSYEELMGHRDRFVARHPKLAFDGAHMASLEWSVDELAAFFDRYPGAVADLAARFSNLQVQSNADLEKVRAFFIKYQDRILYGTDLTDSPPDPAARAQNPPITGDFAREADRVWRADWRYLATPLSQRVEAIDADAKGLNLPREVVDKIYWKNAARFFKLKQAAQ
jgi:hypothetical protein